MSRKTRRGGSPGGRLRAFVAIDLPDAVTSAIARLQVGLPLGRAVPAANLHLTLAFLDSQPADALADLDAELGLLALPRFEVVLRGPGGFGGEAPKLLHVGVAPCPELDDLHRQVVSAARRAGMYPSRRRFQPHVTIARFSPSPIGAEAARLARFCEANAGFAPPAWTVRHFRLVQSTLRPTGALYETLAEYRLR